MILYHRVQIAQPGPEVIGVTGKVIPNIEGPCSTPNSKGGPGINEYLVAEGKDDFRLVHMDANQIITMKRVHT
jgi:hypothetical protein